MTSPNSGSFAVDGAGQIIRPGNQVRIFQANFSEPGSGTVVRISRRYMCAEVDTGDSDPMVFPLSRLSRADDDSEPLWVHGSL